ncbi:family 1 encapsulin nanocompartment shell protein [Anaerobranca gottschalkii]|uniref:Type 1 encapsulin shell protein n=1 Tax=Anaerobranca gottschalkii DSM 13577 TaxID=1120990 RepID=A0A1H9ZYV9_9FIRM|nr:family 1 encapsulin nanocompartment shell protein [Anaerobranca gottschalkii]SES87015.1 Uncharacterized protein, linocin/CFP29 family [Anaerobranca gottschalkii DSM 13577]
MDVLKRNLAPLTKEVWDEIEERAAQVLKTNLSARKVVNVQGPKGWDYNALATGRLTMIEGTNSGLYEVQPLVETRFTFELDRWEMDNFIRGAKDIDLTSLEEAAKKIAEFEENAIYNGFPQGNIKGLMEVAETTISLGEDVESILKGISQGILKLRDAFEEGPYTLIVGEKVWNLVNQVVNGYPLKKIIEELLGKEIVYSKYIDGALLLPFNHNDLELTIGHDFSIGYEWHDNKKVKLFISESFTFRVLNNSIIVKYTA